MQQSTTVIEIRQFEEAGSVLKASAFSGIWTGESAKQGAIDHAKARARFGHGEIRVPKRWISGIRD